MTSEEPLYEVVDWPDVSNPVLVIVLEGWLDAGFGAAGAMAHLLGEVDNEVVARFDTEVLVDHRSRRPVVHLVDGVNRGITWPTIELRHGVDLEGNDVLLLTGAEPDVRWRAFVEESLGLAGQLGVGLAVGLGAYPNPVPHTRPTRLTTTATMPELVGQVGTPAGTVDAPAGVQAALERQCAEVGIPFVGLWAQVPHYAAAMAYPGASLGLLDNLEKIAGVRVDTSALREADRLLKLRLDELVGENPEHRAMLHQLEATYDEASSINGEVPSGDELAAELERYLRDLDR